MLGTWLDKEWTRFDQTERIERKKNPSGPWAGGRKPPAQAAQGGSLRPPAEGPRVPSGPWAVRALPLAILRASGVFGGLADSDLKLLLVVVALCSENRTLDFLLFV